MCTKSERWPTCSKEQILWINHVDECWWLVDVSFKSYVVSHRMGGRNPAPPKGRLKLYKSWDKAPFSTGAGFRNHPPYVVDPRIFWSPFLAKSWAVTPGRTRKLTNVSCRFSSSRPRGSRKRTVRTPISSPERGENPSKNRGFTGATLIIVIFHNLGINQQKILDETLDLCIKYVYIKGVL